jgi:CDP-2,3-bis-(O-geranylgeranyl)-sn-glycerol synthase
MLQVPLLLGVLLLLGVANGSPVVAAKLLKGRFGAPLDGGRKLGDGRAVFGSAKTARGLVVSIASTTLAAPALGFEWGVGIAIAIGAMVGDLTSSFIKRRLRLEPHAQAFGLDQIPEALLPLLIVRDELGLSWLDVTGLLMAFIALQLGLSRVLFRLGIRDRPY